VSAPDYDILAVGDLNIDLILSGIRDIPEFGREVLASGLGMHLGGCTANLAVFCHRLGLRVAFVARVGCDDFGDFLIRELGDLGLTTEHIIRDETLGTGLTASLSAAHDRAFVTYVGTIDSLTAEDVPDELLARCRHLHLGSYFLQTRLQPGCAGLFRRARAAGLTTSLDTGYDPYETWDAGVREVQAQTDVFLPNEIEALEITRAATVDQALADLAQSCPLVALKLGADGSVARQGETLLQQGIFPVEVVDTTCCGDAFDAGFLSAMLQGLPLAECLRWGSASGGLIAGGSGNAAERLSREAVEGLIRGSRPSVT
jgi:sugar/nucleoside kinase (ribokinase family)